MLGKMFSGFAFSKADRRAREYRDLIRQEAALGGELFGPIPPNGRREFFCLDRHTWVWHEEWDDEQGVHHAVTTRYDVRPQGVYKAQDGQSYQPVSFQEGRRLYKVMDLYNKTVKAKLYHDL
ncbi:MAG TPA: hypothetical protein VLF71_00135 [Candidatus Saccharimonadales bacterium]|nr:hypothetical protein [Candidatus Saccharimonadales bacterium]